MKIMHILGSNGDFGKTFGICEKHHKAIEPHWTKNGIIATVESFECGWCDDSKKDSA